MKIKLKAILISEFSFWFSFLACLQNIESIKPFKTIAGYRDRPVFPGALQEL